MCGVSAMLTLLLGAINVVGAIANSVDSCPGYSASNVRRGSERITADLRLAGDACDIYGRDLPNLRLLVEYQTGQPAQLNESPVSSFFVLLTVS